MDTKMGKIEPEPLVAWATDCRDKYASKSDNPQDKTYPGNHDSGYAGRILMSDGNLAWAAVVSDGAGGSEEGLKISALAVQDFVSAVRDSSLAELSDPASRDAGLRGWTKTLHEEAWNRFKGGYATFCGAVVLPPPAVGNAAQPPIKRPGWRLFTLNVGDSQILKLNGDGKCMGITPDAPPNNANVEGHNPIRVVGREPKDGFALLDVEEFPLPAEGPCWILAGSDGFFSKKRGKDELCIFSSGDLRDVCMGGAPFHELPALAIRRSLANAQKLGCAEMMDNATVAMLGFRVPQTNLSAASGNSLAASPPSTARSAASGAQVAPSSPAGRQPAAASEANRRAAQAAQTRPKAADAGGAGRHSATPLRAAALVVALALGFLIGRLFAPPSEATPKPEPVAPVVHVDLQGVPKTGRCAYCLDLAEKGQINREESFHWAKDCPRRKTAGPDSQPQP